MSSREGGAVMLAALPHVWAVLAVDARLRCREVCVAWRGALDSDPELWSQLDLSRESGVAHDALAEMPRFQQPEADLPMAHAGWQAQYERKQRGTRLNLLLAAAAARARGLRSVDLSELARLVTYYLSLPLLRDIAAANADSLRTLRIHGGRPRRSCMPRVSPLQPEDVLGLLQVAPRLASFEADVGCHNAPVACELLGREGLYAPLRVRTLVLYSPDMWTRAQAAALGAVALAHDSLTAVEFLGHPSTMVSALAPLLEALAEPQAGVSDGFAGPPRPALRLMFRFCCFPEEVLLALARLLRCNRVADLAIVSPNRLPLVPAALCGALRDCTSLTTLEFAHCAMPHDGYAELLGAVTGHGTVKRLQLFMNTFHGPLPRLAAGVSLARLLASPSSALTDLVAKEQELGDAELQPLCAALRGNTRLRRLSLSHAEMSAEFAELVLAPAARACVSLRVLETVRSADSLFDMGTQRTDDYRERIAAVLGTIGRIGAELATRAAAQ